MKLLLLTVSMFVSGLYSVAVSGADEWRSAVTGAMKRHVKNNGLPSLQIAIGHNGKIIFDDATGYADLENRVLATKGTLYRTASISKWMTAAVTMKLSEQGLIDLDADVQNYCSNYPKKKFSISTRQILTHTSGIRHYKNFDELLEHAVDENQRGLIKHERNATILGLYRRFTDRKMPLEGFKNDPLLFQPGTDWSYSSHGFRLIGCILEGASGKLYQDLLQELVFTPSAMASITEDDAWAIVPNRAAVYRAMKGKKLRRADMRDTSGNLPAGGHLSTAGDLARFVLTFNDGRLVSLQNVTLMTTPYDVGETLRNKSSWRDAIPSKGHYGYGVMIFPSEGSYRYGHSGQQPGASTIVIYIPEQDITLAVMTNMKGWRGYISFTNELVKILSLYLKKV